MFTFGLASFTRRCISCPLPHALALHKLAREALGARKAFSITRSIASTVFSHVLIFCARATTVCTNDCIVMTRSVAPCLHVLPISTRFTLFALALRIALSVTFFSAVVSWRASHTLTTNIPGEILGFATLHSILRRSTLSPTVGAIRIGRYVWPDTWDSQIIFQHAWFRVACPAL